MTKKSIPDLDTIGRRLRKARESKQLTLDGLSERLLARGCKMSSPSLSRLERGLTRARWETLEHIGAVLECNPKSLVPPQRLAVAKVA